jgi:hypothetical protein
VLVEGTIRTYKPGSVVARAFAIPLAASFDGEVSVRDPADDRILLSGSFDKFWVLGGTFDSKAIDNLVAETSEAIAKTLALWRQGRVEGRKR